jgi:hypothetical protein
MFSLVLTFAAVIAALSPADIAPTSVQPLVRYHVLAPNQTTAQQVQQFLSTPGSMTIDYPGPTGGRLVVKASYQGAINVAGLSYYSEPARPGQPWAPTPKMYQNAYVVPTVAGVPYETEVYVGRCADELPNKNTSQWQLTSFAIARWASSAPGTMSSWTSFGRREIAHMKSNGWTFLGEGNAYNSVAKYTGISWRFTRSWPNRIRTVYVSLNNAGPVTLTEKEYSFDHAAP